MDSTWTPQSGCPRARVVVCPCGNSSQGEELEVPYIGELPTGRGGSRRSRHERCGNVPTANAGIKPGLQLRRWTLELRCGHCVGRYTWVIEGTGPIKVPPMILKAQIRYPRREVTARRGHRLQQARNRLTRDWCVATFASRNAADVSLIVQSRCGCRLAKDSKCSRNWRHASLMSYFSAETRSQFS
jgi:hypothetical protein